MHIYLLIPGNATRIPKKGTRGNGKHWTNVEVKRERSTREESENREHENPDFRASRESIYQAVEPGNVYMAPLNPT